jgi:hypothetical protein
MYDRQRALCLLPRAAGRLPRLAGVPSSRAWPYFRSRSRPRQLVRSDATSWNLHLGKYRGSRVRACRAGKAAHVPHRSAIRERVRSPPRLTLDSAAIRVPQVSGSSFRACPRGGHACKAGPRRKGSLALKVVPYAVRQTRPPRMSTPRTSPAPSACARTRIEGRERERDSGKRRRWRGVRGQRRATAHAAARRFVQPLHRCRRFIRVTQNRQRFPLSRSRSRGSARWRRHVDEPCAFTRANCTSRACDSTVRRTHWRVRTRPNRRTRT